jgi:hypothetical protein
MTARRLRAPAADGGLLVDPPGLEASGLAAANADRLARWDYNVQGRSAVRLRAQARRELLGLAREFLRRHGLDTASAVRPDADSADLPLIVTGHQPELFHPGVWVKNFATAGIARSTGGVALNLIVDNDIPKDSVIRVPTARDGPLRAIPIEFDGWQGELPYEDWRVRDEAAFASFPDRIHEVLGEVVSDPLIDDFWPRAVRRGAEVDTIGLRFSLARREILSSR